MPRSLLRLLLVPALACMATAGSAVASDAALRPFVDRLIADTMALYTSALPDGAAREHGRRLLGRFFDMAGMAREALGPPWDTASPAERQAFRAAFEERIINAFVHGAGAGGNVAMVLVGTRPERSGTQLAATRLIFPERPEQTWIWRLRPAGNGWRVVDLLIDGRSTLAAERDEYARVLAFHNGDMAALIAFVRNRK